MFHEYKKNIVNVIYISSDENYEESYSVLRDIHSEVNYIRERNFKEDLIKLIDTNMKYTVFFVDDIVWKERFSVKSNEFRLLQNDPEILCLSLRLDRHLSYCYAYDMTMDAPEFDKQNCWSWNGMDGDFGYPMSLDGHIYRTDDILPLLKELPYDSPNKLEGVLSQNPIDRSKMICLEKAAIFNMPINKVQTHVPNRYGSISAEHLNQVFLDGYGISYAPLVHFNNDACHQEVDIALEKRSKC
jgi:hypothetical protein